MIKLHLNLVHLLATGFKNNKVKCSFDGIFSFFEVRIWRDHDDLIAKLYLLDEITILFSVCNENVGTQDIALGAQLFLPKRPGKDILDA